jgi:hypothetical protein
MIRIAITAFGDFSVGDFVGLTPYKLDQQFVSVSLSAGQSAEIYVTRSEFETGIRQSLEKLSQMRVQIPGTTRTSPLMSYDVLSDERPRFLQAEGGALSLSGGTQSVTFRGQNLIAGRKASAVLGTGSSQLTFTAAGKGPRGQKVTINLKAPGSAGVELVYGLDGAVTVNVTPASGGSGTQANTIAAQFTGAVTKHVTCVGGGTGDVRCPVNGIVLTHNERHAGAGQAFVDLPTTLARTRLRVTRLLPGSRGNEWSVTVLAPSGGGSVAVNTSTKLLTVTPATGSGNADASVVAAQINNNATAQKHFFAEVVGTNGDDVVASTPIPRTYLCGGCGETPVASIGGASVDVIAYTDTAVTLQVADTALVTAGCVAGEDALVALSLDEVILSGTVGVAS